MDEVSWGTGLYLNPEDALSSRLPPLCLSGSSFSTCTVRWCWLPYCGCEDSGGSVHVWRRAVAVMIMVDRSPTAVRGGSLAKQE